MKKILLFLTGTFLFLFPAAAQTDNTISILQSQFSVLAAQMQVLPDLQLTNDDRNLSTPDNKISLGKLFFRQNSQKLDAATYLFIVRFILAHELAHQLQFRSYGAGITKSSCEQRRLYECQADIISGIALGRIYDLSDTMRATEDYKSITSGLAYIYNTGDRESGLALHPTPAQRRAAFRYGLGFNPANQNRLAIERNTGPDSQKSDSLGWSMGLARLIMHYPLTQSRNITYDSMTIHWNTGTEHPFVTFTQEYVNNSAQPVRINVCYQIRGVYSYGNRKLRDTDYTKPLLSGENKFMTATLQPGEKRILTGDLNWLNVSLANFMPVIIYPGEEDGLYNAESLSGNLGDPSNNCIGNFADLDSQYKYDNQKTGFFLALNQAERSLLGDDWKALEGGFSYKEGRTKSLTYQSALRFPNSLDNTIMVWPGGASYRKGFLNVNFYNDNDSGYAKAKFQQLTELLSSYYGKRVNWDTTLPDNERNMLGITGKIAGTYITVSLTLEQMYDNSWMVSMGFSSSHYVTPASPPIGGNEDKMDRFLRTIITSQKDNFNTIDGQPTANADLKSIVPPYIYSSRADSREASFLLCRNYDPDEIIAKCDSVKDLIAKKLDAMGNSFTLSKKSLADTTYCYTFFYSDNQGTRADIVLQVSFPDAETSGKGYYLSLHLIPPRRRTPPAAVGQ